MNSGSTPGPRPVAVITGASLGIGAELARIFAAHGHEVVLVARNEARLAALADEIANRGGARPHVLVADLGVPEAGARIAGELVARGLEPAFVVNNAGFGLVGPTEALDRDEQLAMIDLNVRTLTDLSLRWIASIERHRGGILNVGSVAGFLSGPGMAVYYATKAYVLSFSEALHQELAPKGIRVTVLAPGPVSTGFQARSGMRLSGLLRRIEVPASTVARAGFDGLMAGKRLVVPGAANKLATFLPRFLPRAAMLRVADAQGRGMAAKGEPAGASGGGR